MKVTNGHLTQTEKKAVKAIMDSGLKAGRIGKKTYQLSIEGNVLSVVILVMDRGLVPVPGSPLRLSKYSSTVTL